MKITDVQIDGFGVWSDLQLDQLADGCTVLFGQNEAGKTTLMEFIRSVLYGFSPDRRLRYLPPVRGTHAGGSLGLVGAGGRFTVKRTPGSAMHDDLGKVEVLNASGTRQGQHILGTLLSGIDEQIFNNVFAVGLRELQELSTLDDTEAAAHLYKLTSGLDRVSLIDVIRELAASRTQLLAADGSKSELLSLLERREKLRGEIKELTSTGHRWAQLAVQRTEVQEELTRLEEHIHRMERESRAVEMAMQVGADWAQRVAVAAQLKKLGPPVTLPERAVERLDALNAHIAKHREEVEQVRRQRRTLMEEAVAQPVNRAVCANASRIEAVCEHGPWLTSLEQQVQRHREEIDELQADLRARWEKLGLAPDDMPEFTPDLAERAATLHNPARAVRDAVKRVQDAKAEQEQARREADELREQLASHLESTGRAELSEALEEAGSRVAGFRRRLQLEERLDKIERQRKEIEQDHHALLEDQVLPLHTLIWCGIPFVAGVALILGSLFSDWVTRVGWSLPILGVVCWVVAVAVKLFLEQTISNDFENCKRQLRKAETQVQELHQERDQLDSQLPAGGGPLDARLLAAEEYVKQLEELTPLGSKRQTALQHAEALKAKLEKATETVREARDEWRAALRSANLPLAMTPEQIQVLVEGNDQTFEIGRRLQARREELSHRQLELTAVIQRINTLFAEVQLTAASEDPRTRLRQLAAALNEQKRWIERRREMRQEHRGLKSTYRQHVRELRQLAQQRRVLILQAKVANEQQLRKLAQRQLKIEDLTQQHEELTTRIGLAIGTQCTEQAVGEVLDSHQEDKLESYYDRLLTRLHEAQERLTQLHQSRGEMQQEMKTLAENKRLPAAKLELGCLEEHIQRAAARWRVLAVTSLMLEDIRQIYETERQPETLAEASTYLVRLTEGRYKRIWTPLAQDGLRLDTADGESLPLDVLSQGTREAIFLSLRLALASAYARRGALLPLVLDDVLVNLDLRRAKAAAEVIRDFANGGHQLLLFTCHHHIVKIFQRAQVEVRPLPTRYGEVPLEMFEDEAPAAAADEPVEDAAEPVEPAEAFESETALEATEPSFVDFAATDVTESEPAESVEEEEAEAVDVPEPAEVAAEVEETVAASAEPVEDAYDHTIWDDGEELLLAREEEPADDPLAPAYHGAGRGQFRADRWWERNANDPAA